MVLLDQIITSISCKKSIDSQMLQMQKYMLSWCAVVATCPGCHPGSKARLGVIAHTNQAHKRLM